MTMKPGFFISLLFVTLPVCFLVGQTKAAQDTGSPDQLVRRVIANELKAEKQDHSHWRLRLETHNPNGSTEVDEVVESGQGDLKKPILMNGHPLTAEQRRKADARIQQLVRDPGPLRKSRQQEDQDTARSQRLLKMLPDAFTYKYGERRGDLVQLNFAPNPKFHPSTHEAEVFHAMEGSLWVDSKQLRVEEIAGRLTREVKFAGGLLGHLDQGGTFDVKQAPVAPGYWELTALQVQMKGKALFFKTIGVHQYYTRSDFKRVSDDLPVAKAAEMLKDQTLSAQSQTGAKQ